MTLLHMAASYRQSGDLIRLRIIALRDAARSADDPDERCRLEQRIRAVLNRYGIEVVDFPYFSSPGDSAVGCYLNFLEAGDYIFLPVFGAAMDREATALAEALFDRPVVPVLLREVARQGGCLNCITWERPEPGGL